MGRIGFIQDYLFMYLPFKDFLIKKCLRRVFRDWSLGSSLFSP